MNVKNGAAQRTQTQAGWQAVRHMDYSFNKKKMKLGHNQMILYDRKERKKWRLGST